jgi:NADPH2:quinone reductase
VPLPKGFPFEQAAAIPVAYTTAWRMLIPVAELRAGEDVLIVGIGGGVASAALQIARRAGARIFAASRSDEKLARARELGAAATVNLSREDFSEWVMRQTDGRGVDVVADPVGAATWPLSIRSLARGGRLVICGASSGSRPNIDIREIYQRHRRILGAPMGSLRDFQTVLGFVTRGEIAPVIDRILPLEEVAEGHRALEGGEQFGKIVIRVQS